MEIVQLSFRSLIITIFFVLLWILANVQCDEQRPASCYADTCVRIGLLLSARHQLLFERKLIRIASPYSRRFNFPQNVDIQTPTVVFGGVLGPSNILDMLCKEVLAQNISALVSVSFYEDAKGDAVNALQYLFQLSSYLRIPVISWLTEGAEKSADDLLVLQMASTVQHQVKAVFSILERYKWTQFSVVLAKQLAGHDVFINAVRQERNKESFKTRILSVVEIANISQPDEIRTELQTIKSETRVVVIFASKSQATEILRIASELEKTGADYMWICMSKVIGDAMSKSPPPEYPVGMLGIDMDMTDANMENIMSNGIKIYIHALDMMVRQNNVPFPSFVPNISCDADNVVWTLGKKFYNAMTKVKIALSSNRNSPEIQFTKDGATTYAEFDVVNLVVSDSRQRIRSWKKVGRWDTINGLRLDDIVWPGQLPVPPRGRPEKFHLTVVTLREEPYVIMQLPGPTGRCDVRTAPCLVHSEQAIVSSANASGGWITKCCTGLSIDLLMKLGTDIGFEFDIYEVEDRKWGKKLANESWNGLVADLQKKKANLAMTSLTVTKERQNVISFSTAYLGTGIGIVVAKQEGRISPTAFLEPFNYITWIILVVACIQTVSIFIFAFEWLSPSGFNMQSIPDEDNRFSFFRVYWLVFTIFFGAPCPVTVPRSFTAKFLTAVWACCAFVFIAVYTANLATFMITKDDVLSIKGIQDGRFQNQSHINPFRFGTMSSGSTSETIRQSFDYMYNYMQKFNKDNVTQGIEAVKNGELDAFLYDASVLEYRVGSDPNCKIQTVGSWFATTGYAIGFPEGSSLITLFDEHLLKYQQNGYLEQLQQFWLSGACNLKSQKDDKSSHALGIKNFTSAFIFLGAGIASGILCLIVEWIYFKLIRFGICSSVLESSVCRFLSVNISKAVRAEKGRQSLSLVPVADFEERRRSSAVEADLARISTQLVIARMHVQKLENIQKRLRRSPLRKEGSICMRAPTLHSVATEATVSRRWKRAGMEPDVNGTKSSLHVVEMETVL